MSNNELNLQQFKINRDDMLELTRRMTLKRNCFSRIAGAYLDEDGFIDGTFNTQFLKLTAAEKTAKLAVAKTIPFSDTNKNLKGYRFQKQDEGPGSIWQLLMAMRECELKNDALLEVFYEIINEKCCIEGPYAICVYYGAYDVPLKASDKESLWESEEVFRFMIGMICPLHDDYELEKPEWGFVFPAFTDRSTDIHGIALFDADTEHPQNIFGGK